MQNYYSWCGTRLHFILDDEIANGYNRAQDAFAAAQKKFKDEYGISWDPTKNHALELECASEDIDAWNAIAKLINTLVEVNGGSLSIQEDELTSDYLIKL